MQIGIVGLPQSGKTTVFNLLTRGSADTSAFGAIHDKPNVGVAKVVDERVDALTEIFNPKRKTYAELTYVDMPAPPDGFGKTRGISGQFLNQLQRMDALLVVVRAFEDPSVAHVAESIDPLRDAETMLYEIAFADLEIVERRLERLADLYKGAKPQERQAMQVEETLLNRLKDGLEGGVGVRDQEVTDDEARRINGFQLLSAKPAIVAANYGEDQVDDVESLESGLATRVAEHRVPSGAVCGSLEAELSRMAEEEQQEFRESLGVGVPGQQQILELSYRALDLVTFLTVGDDEVKAWTVPKGTVAQEAAGRIHSDIERGFIRAETVKYEDFIECGSHAEARKRGLLRAEGKTYEVSDGDLINYQFNV